MKDDSHAKSSCAITETLHCGRTDEEGRKERYSQIGNFDKQLVPACGTRPILV